jgi:DNA-binding transcriptional ArsR family regulator
LRSTIKEAIVAVRKTGTFSEDLVALAAVAKSLSHPVRLEILRILAGRACICGDLVARLPLSQATVSQHLKELKKVGLIRGRIEGPRICYGLDHEAVKAAQAGFAGLFAGIACCPGKGETSEEGG